MKVVVLEAIKKIVVKNVATPACRKGEVLVKVRACGICRTDMKAYHQGQRDLHLPRILGHEITGTVAVVGEGVTQVKPGDRVQVAPGLSCGNCSYCINGMDHLCNHIKVMGFHYDGGFAEYVLVPINGVSRGYLNIIPNHLSFEESVLTEPLACSINMQDSLQVGSGDTVVIFGAGPLGLLNAKLARVRGAGTLILVETNETRLNQARNVFDYSINPLVTPHLAKVMDITGGTGADVVIPCCPDPETIGDGLGILSKRGRFGFFSGLINQPENLHTNLNLIHYKELSVYGAYGCSSRHNQTAMNLLASGAIKVKTMITRTLPLEEALSGLKMVRALQETKIVLSFDS